MIRYFEQKDENAVVNIWKDAFGDREKEILSFLEHFGKNMLVLEMENRIVSMLTLLPVTIKGKKGRYVYAVATDRAYRNKGFAGRLIEYAKQFENDGNFLVILPQNDSLFGFYKRFGFLELYCSVKIEKRIDFVENSPFSIEELTENEYFEYRKAFFGAQSYVEWDKNMLVFFKKMYGGAYYKVISGNKAAALCFCYENGDKLVVSELLTREKTEEIVKFLGNSFKKKTAFANAAAKNGEKSAMIYPESFLDTYFGLGMN